MWQIKQENIYRLEIHDILRSKGWKKLAVDSLWTHPDFGVLHVLFALHLALKPKKQNLFRLNVVLSLVFILLFIIGAFLMVVYL
jgi:hypothetical protein